MIRLSLKQISTIGSTILVGLVAGIMLGTGLAMYTARALPETCWTMSFQLVDALFAKTMPPLFLTTVVALGIAAVTNQRTCRWLFAAATLLALSTLVLTVGLEIPITIRCRHGLPAPLRPVGRRSATAGL